MNVSPRYRAVKVGGCLTARHELDATGAHRLRSAEPLQPYPARLTDRLEEWARHAPDRVQVARRGPDGEWRKITYAQMLDRVRRIGQAIAERGLSPERPIAILSDNDLEHYTLALAAQWVGVPYTPVSVAYSTEDGTATAGSDYAAASGTLTFAAGETSKMIHVDIEGDALAEGNENFKVNLSNPVGATIADGTATGTIVNDDPATDQGLVGNGKADTFAITWTWGSDTAIDFDTALDTLDFNWMGKDHFSIAEANGSTVITIEGNKQTYTLTGVSLTELSLANIAAKDAGALSEWATALETAHAARDYDLMI